MSDADNDKISVQPAILVPVPRVARYLSFRLNLDTTPAASWDTVRALVFGCGSICRIGLWLTIQKSQL